MARSGLTVRGTVLDVEHKKGEFEGRQFDFHVAHVVAGRKVVEVRFNPDNGEARPPAIDASIAVEVSLPDRVRCIATRYVPDTPPPRTP